MGGRKKVGLIIQEAIGLYKRNLLLFFVVSLIAYGATYGVGQLGLLVARALGLDNSSLNVLFGPESIKEMLAGWGINVLLVVRLFTLVGTVFTTILSMLFSELFSIPGNALTVGAYDVMLGICKGRKRSAQEAAVRLKQHWARYLGISAWSSLFIWLWSFLFLIPGLVKTYAYLLAPFLILDYPGMTVRQALKKSVQITKGYKGRLFGLMILVSLPPAIPFYILGFVLMVSGHLPAYTATIAIVSPVLSLLIIQPIMTMANTIAYLDLKRAAIDRGLLPSQG